jgi:hypothetical protein
MCLSCGCGEPNESHGDERHITMRQLEAAAKASDISVMQAAENIIEGVRGSSGEQGSATATDMRSQRGQHSTETRAH